MPIEYQKYIRRADLQANPDKVYIFGDNVERVGLGGQAREMRGEPNAFGIATKWSPDRCFSDADYAAVLPIWTADFMFLTSNLIDFCKTLVIPRDGIGTGLADLPTKAPKLYRRLTLFFNALEMDARACA